MLKVRGEALNNGLQKSAYARIFKSSHSIPKTFKITEPEFVDSNTVEGDSELVASSKIEAELSQELHEAQQYEEGVERVVAVTRDRVCLLKDQVLEHEKTARMYEAQLVALLDEAARLEPDLQGTKQQMEAAFEMLASTQSHVYTLQKDVVRTSKHAHEINQLVAATEKGDLCVICFNKPALRFQHTFFTPCGHGSTCEVCSSKLMQDGCPCPECRKQIQGTIRVYYE